MKMKIIFSKVYYATGSRYGLGPPMSIRIKCFAAVIASVASLGCAGANDAKDGDAVAVGTGPVYALLAITFNPDDSATSYVVLSDTPDLSHVSLSGAREFGGRQNIATASRRTPRVARHSLMPVVEIAQLRPLRAVLRAPARAFDAPWVGVAVQRMTGLLLRHYASSRKTCSSSPSAPTSVVPT